MSKSPGPIRSAWNATLLIFGVCLLLWLCVQLIQSIWIWLIGGLVIGMLIFAISLWLRRRGRRW